MSPLPSTPETWGRDVVLADGSTACIRPVTAADDHLIANLHGRLSEESVRMRYFGAHPRLSEDEMARLVEQEGPDHLALAAERGGQFIGMAQYDRVPGSDVAEVAFVVADDHQGLGIGTLLLEYLASEGRRFGLKRFAADTLLENSQMVQVFRDAGFTQRSRLEAGVIRVVMDISPTQDALSALYERDRLAAARSMQRLLRPHSVAVIGASRKAGTVGHELVRNLVGGGFQGPFTPSTRQPPTSAACPASPVSRLSPATSTWLSWPCLPALCPRRSRRAAARGSVASLSSPRTLPRTVPPAPPWSARQRAWPTLTGCGSSAPTALVFSTPTQKSP